MFLKFLVTNALHEFVKINDLNEEILTVFERGAIDSFMPAIKQSRLDPMQGAVLVIVGTISNAAQTGTLTKVKQHSPNLYRDLEVLWNYCASLLSDYEHQWGRVVAHMGDFPTHSNGYAEQCA